ncbi:hypothetical protein BJV77DRAFT_998412, partial [Russula vinacea]
MNSLEESKTTLDGFLFSAKPHGDSSGRPKSYPFKLQNTRQRYEGVSHVLTSWQQVWFVELWAL